MLKTCLGILLESVSVLNQSSIIILILQSSKQFLVYSCFQLSSLSRHAEDLFGEMIAESTSILNRTVSLQGRVDKLSVKVKNLDSNVEEGKDIRAL